MNSSPPPPSFTLPPLTSSGQFPITPSPTPSPGAEKDGLDFKVKSLSAVESPSKGKTREGKARVQHGTHDIGEDGGRISMYVTLFDEMINTVLSSESYLFTAREIWVLRYILSLPYEPHYLLTRLLLRRQGKIHPCSSLVNAYSAELGDDGVKRAMRALCRPLNVPEEITSEEAKDAPNTQPEASTSKIPFSRPALPTPVSAKAIGKRRVTPPKPWSNLSTGLSVAEEKADPQLAEAIRESLWAAQVGRVEVDDEGLSIHTPPPERPASTRSVSDSSSAASPPVPAGSFNPMFEEPFSLTPRPPDPVMALARDETTLSLEEIMSCISADELRRVAKARKVPTSMMGNREMVMNALRGVARKQTVLGFARVPIKAKGADHRGDGQQATLPFTPTKSITSESLLISQLLPALSNQAILLTSSLHSLISRVNLIFSRTPPISSTSSSLMLPSILVQSHKRRYPEYGSPTRSMIWSKRDDLLVWQRAAEWEVVVGDALGDSWADQRKNPTPGWNRKEIIGRKEGALVVKRIWEGVWTVWSEMTEGEAGKAVDVAREEGGLVGDRFKTGHVLTRIVYKGATALGILHEYDQECKVLRALLAQRRWRRSKRGAWYERLALVLMNHYNGSEEEKEDKRREAVQVCIDGLLDEDTHLIYRPALSRRLTRLENRLNLPADERHISNAELLKCFTRDLVAPRVAQNMAQAKERGRSESVRDRDREASLGLGEEEGRGGVQQVGKSVWTGREGEVTVEGWVLEWWEAKGYKGFHSEGSILTTLFTLLMWPVLFHPLPGAFETRYQTAPLDLGEDTFAPARQELIETRLAEMSSTKKALEMLEEVDTRERDRATWAVGVNWDYGRDELAEILSCLGGKAISVICRMLSEEYRHRVSGVPDLIVWDIEEKEARFVEVKGPGDSLSETQKVWIDVLLSAGVPVEVCRVKAKDVTSTASKLVKRKPPAKSQTPARKKSKDGGGWGKKKDHDYGSLGEEDEGDGEGEDDEWKYESGEEGKATGGWEG
ncbi:fanconi-associated nuclease 1, partial [Tremellales sp. Uapishka_1]